MFRLDSDLNTPGSLQLESRFSAHTEPTSHSQGRSQNWPRLLPEDSLKQNSRLIFPTRMALCQRNPAWINLKQMRILRTIEMGKRRNERWAILAYNPDNPPKMAPTEDPIFMPIFTFSRQFTALRSTNSRFVLLSYRIGISNRVGVK